MDNNENKLLSEEDLKVYFRSEIEIARAVDGVSFDVHREETVCLVGESGCGKTVTALSIMGLVPIPPGEVTAGRVLFRDQNLLDLDDSEMEKIRGNQIAMVFQEPLTSLNPVFTIGDQIGEAIHTHKDIPESEVTLRSEQLLKDVGIASPAERLSDYPHQLSGGQRQRVMIAMALACNPDLIIADEPTTALDVTVQAQILRLLGTIQKQRAMSILYITHDLGVVSKVADHVCVMYAGIIAEQGNRQDIFKDPKHPYTQGLLRSVPNIQLDGGELYKMEGSPPNLLRPPSGCRFHPRCPFVMDICRTEEPAFEPVEGGDQITACWLYQKTPVGQEISHA
jgi:oligopeptide/dipeptide ABC transporter ATP-binding protein